MSKNKENVPKIRFPGFTDVWEQRRLGDIVEFFSGLTYSPDNVIEDRGTLILRSSNVKNGEIVDADNVYVKSDIVNSDNVQVGDVIVVVRNGSRNLIGKHAQIKKQMNDTVIGAFMTGVRSETPNFTNAMLDTQQFNIEINKNLGATINQITTGAFKKMKFHIPIEKDERKQVGAFFEQIDCLITLHQRKLNNVKKLKAGLLQKMFPKNGENFPEIRFPGFTDAWERRKVLDIAPLQRGFDLPVSEMEPGSYPVVMSNGIGAYHSKYKAKAPGVVTGRSGTIGNLTFVEANYWPHNTALWVTDFKGNDAKFIYYLYQKLDLKRYGTGSGVPTLNRNDVHVTKANIPSVAEQKQISRLFANLDHLIFLHQRKLEHLQEQKKSLLQQMFV